MATMQRVRSSWWGHRFHIGYTIVVFVILASLDNAAIWLIPSMTKPVVSGTSSSTLATRSSNCSATDRTQASCSGCVRSTVFGASTDQRSMWARMLTR